MIPTIHIKEKIFDILAHGDSRHREWLRNTIMPLLDQFEIHITEIEREACAQVAENEEYCGDNHGVQDCMKMNIAAAIRERK